MSDDARDALRDRLNRVTFATPHGLTVISWDSRELLLSWLQGEGCAKEISAIRGPGTSRPIELEEPLGRHIVASIISGTEQRGVELPADLIALRDTLGRSE